MSATLASLRIRNLALVEDITWEMPPGFVAVTGETGAGKSVILGALKLILGERADKSLIRTGADFCTVEAAFENADDPRLAKALNEQGAEPCEEGRLIIKRTLTAEGAGKQFVNGSACNVNLLRTIGADLIDLHGPHDHQSLFSRDHQTLILDSFAGSDELREKYAALRRTLLSLENEQRSILEGEQSAVREIELLEHQTKEIDSAALQPGEEEKLVSRQRTAANSRRIEELCGQMISGLSEDENSATERLSQIARLARELQRIDPGAASIVTQCEAVFEAIKEASDDIQSYVSKLEQAGEGLAEVEARLDLIQSLKRKYGTTIEEVITFGENAASRLGELRNREQRRGDLDGEIEAARKAMLEQGGKLGAKRKDGAKKLAVQVQRGLKDLGFLKSEFSIQLDPAAEPGPKGLELAEFLFVPNPGEPPRPLRAIASSGEISRVMLALKGVLAEQDGVPVLVFDEIDANVGGEIASRVGEKMRELGRSRQVLCITHLPQVAASAAAQFVVTKEVKDGRTRTLLSETKSQSREEEIARMLGGKNASALAHAKTLLQAT